MRLLPVNGTNALGEPFFLLSSLLIFFSQIEVVCINDICGIVQKMDQLLLPQVSELATMISQHPLTSDIRVVASWDSERDIELIVEEVSKSYFLSSHSFSLFSQVGRDVGHFIIVQVVVGCSLETLHRDSGL